MAKKSEEPRCTIVTRYYDNRVDVEITNFEKVNARQIQLGTEEALKQWSTLRRDAIIERRRQDAA